MLSDAEVDALARSILADTIAKVSDWAPGYFHALYKFENGETVPVYAGTSSDGLGSFNCQYLAFDSIKTIIKRCEKVYDNFQAQVETHPDFQLSQDDSIS
jgi:hypothetical protein